MHTRISRGLAAAVTLALALVAFVAAPAQAATTTITGNVSLGSVGEHPGGARVHWSQAVDGNWTSDTNTYVDTDASGDYQVVLPSNGIYRLRFAPRIAGYQSQWWLESQHKGVDAQPVGGFTVNGAPKTGYDVLLPSLGVISGHVYLGDTSQSAGAGQVRVRMVTTCYASVGCVSGPVPTTFTDADGNYSFPNMSNGTFTLAYNYVPNGDFHAPPNKVVTVATGSVNQTGIDATMKPAGTFSGHVALGDAGTAAGAGAVKVSYSGGSPAMSGSVLTDASGDFVATGLAAGYYEVKFDYLPSGAFADEYWDHYYADRQRPIVSVAAGANTPNVNAVLSPGASVSGHVVNFTGRRCRRCRRHREGLSRIHRRG